MVRREKSIPSRFLKCRHSPSAGSAWQTGSNWQVSYHCAIYGPRSRGANDPGKWAGSRAALRTAPEGKGEISGEATDPTWGQMSTSPLGFSWVNGRTKSAAPPAFSKKTQSRQPQVRREHLTGWRAGAEAAS